MMQQKQFLIVFVSIVVTALVVGGGVYWWQQNQRQGNDKSEMMTGIKSSSPLTKTHINRLFTINYPENWRTITNESGGLMEIRQPVDDHAIIDVAYIDARYNNIGACDLTSRKWTDFKVTKVDEVYGDSRLMRYEGVNKLNQPEIAFVALSGGSSTHDCSIIELNDVWASDKDVAWQIINSVKLRK